jgi:hypothetical protein
LWMGSDLASTSVYSASGRSKARCRTDLVDPLIIGVQGYIVDEIGVVGDAYGSLAADQKASEAADNWKRILNTYGLQPSKTMQKTLQWESELGGHSGHPLNTAIVHLRRLIVTQHDHRVGVVSSRARPGDLICVLLGSDVPYILRKSNHEGPAFRHSWRCFLTGCPRAKHKNCCIREVYTIVGQAYIDGIMEYSGDIEDDIENGNLRLREFFLE